MTRGQHGLLLLCCKRLSLSITHRFAPAHRGVKKLRRIANTFEIVVYVMTKIDGSADFCVDRWQSCLPRHSGVFCASSRRRTEQLRCGEVSVRFQQRAKHAMIGAFPRRLALNAHTTIVFENLFKRLVTSSLPSGMACPGQRHVAGLPRQPQRWCLWKSWNWTQFDCSMK